MEFYKAPERFAYTFQNYVFLTRVVQVRVSEYWLLPEYSLTTCETVDGVLILVCVLPISRKRGFRIIRVTVLREG